MALNVDWNKLAQLRREESGQIAEKRAQAVSPQQAACTAASEKMPNIDTMTASQDPIEETDVADTESVEATDPNLSVAAPIDQPTPVVKPNFLDKYSINGSSEELARRNLEAFFILYCLALRGQWTFLFAPPNIGKTLLVIYMLILSLMKNPEIAKQIFYINADDNLDGMISKLHIAEEYGFQMLVPGYKGFHAEKLTGILAKLIQLNQADRSVIILDTAKKFVDMMHKGELRKFNNAVREFVMRGGTVIALAHTNKRAGPNGKPIPEGAADSLSDADCAYIAYEAERDDEMHTKTVVFENVKNRGHVKQRVAFRYSIEDLTYEQRLASVVCLDDEALEAFDTAPVDPEVTAVVEAITASLVDGVSTKMKLKDDAACRCKASKRQVLQVLETYTGNDPLQHKWSFQRGEHGRQYYSLLARKNENHEGDIKEQSVQISRNSDLQDSTQNHNSSDN